MVSRLVRLGIFQPVDIRNIEKELEGLSLLDVDSENARRQALEIQSRDLLRKLSLSPVPGRNVEGISYETIQELFKGIEEKVDGLITQKQELQEELRTKESMLSQVKDYLLFPVKRSSFYSFLEVNLGKLEEKNIPMLERSLEDMPHLLYPVRKALDKAVILLIGLRRDRALVDKVLKGLSWEQMSLPEEESGLSKDVEDKLKIQIKECIGKIEGINSQIKKLADNYAADLSKAQSFLELKKSLLEAKRHSCSTAKTVLLSGWIPREEKDRVRNEIKKITDASYVERKPAEELDIAKEEIPVRFKHNPIFRPFELLISTYGVPRYGTIDPTFFVAISFLLMFGAMFGDLGHGFIFILGSLFLRKSKKENIRQISSLILYCGISSSIFGILYGSFFGYEKIIPAVWIKPIDKVLDVFRISVLFGMAMITLGIILNITNALKDRDYIKALFDKSGLIVGVVYWMAIGYLSELFVSKTPVAPVYLILISTGFILLFLKPFIKAIFRKKKEKEGIFVSFMESLVDILEVVMGYLANTVSFIRIAAFSLAHAGLFFAIFELSRVLKSVGGTPLSIAIIILGNILVILLEGLVVSIQSLRLNYYEFFSKFFMAGKQFYKPLTMQKE